MLREGHSKIFSVRDELVRVGRGRDQFSRGGGWRVLSGRTVLLGVIRVAELDGAGFRAIGVRFGGETLRCARFRARSGGGF